jgi:hypothetical protein
MQALSSGNEGTDMNRALLIILFSLMSCTALSLTPAAVAAAETAVESWKIEFDAVCGQTDNAADLSVAELTKAVERCDALKPQIEALEATPRKLYLKRLQMCRNLFIYMLESKAKEKK